MKRLTRIFLTAFVAGAAQFASAATYTPGDLLLVFRQSGYNDVEFDIGSVSNLLNLTAGSTTPISYDSNLVSNNFNNTFSNVIFAVVGTPSLNDGQPRVWLSDADLVTTPGDVTPNTYATLASKIDGVGTHLAANPQVIDPGLDGSYSHIVSPDDAGSIDSMGGDAPFTVEAASDGVHSNTLALYELVPTTTSPTPQAILLGTFTMAPSGPMTFTASVVTPVITSPPVAATVRAGGSTTFSVSDDGGTNYQWYSNGVAIIGATGSTYTVSNAQSGSGGPYSVVVSNSVYGTSTTSAGAALTIVPAYVGGDLQMVFRESGSSDVEYNIGSVSNYIGLAAGTVVPVSYDINLVTTNFNNTLSNVIFAVVGTPSLNDSDARVWLSDADLVSLPGDVTPNTYSTLASKIDSVATKKAANTHSFSVPLVVNPGLDSSYSHTVSPDDSGSIDSMGGDAPFTVEAASDGVHSNTLALYEMVPTTTSPTPAAIRLGTFTMAPDGPMTFTASAVTPVITSPPMAAAVRAGGSTTFSATAEGGSSFQWYSNGVAIVGATGSTYTVSNAQSGSGGPYSVVVSNSVYGTSTTSAGAALTIVPAYVGGDLQMVFRETGSSDVEYNIGSVSNYMGLAAGAVIPVSYDINLVTTNFNNTLSNVIFAVVGTTSLNDDQPRVWLSDADLVSTPGDVTPNTYSTLASKIDSVATKKAGNTHSFSAPLVINPGLDNSYSHTVSPDDAGSIGSMGGDAPFTVEAASDGVHSNTLALYELVPTTTSPTPQAILLGTFTMAPSGPMTFTASAVTPVITSPSLADQTVGIGATAMFTVSSAGANGYQWLKDGTNVPGQTSSVLTLPNAQLTDAGVYSVMVNNTTYGTSVTSPGAQLTVVGLPTITLNPFDQTVMPGSTVVFTVTATNVFAGPSNPPLSYQWIKNGSITLTDGGNVSGALTTSLTLSNVQAVADAGTYQVSVGNAAGNTNSTSVTLAVVLPPTITSRVRTGSDLVLSGSGGLPGGTYYVLESTNIAAAISTWIPVLTNTFDPSGNFSVTNVVDFAKPAQFFLLQAVP